MVCGRGLGCGSGVVGIVVCGHGLGCGSGVVFGEE